MNLQYPFKSLYKKISKIQKFKILKIMTNKIKLKSEY